MITFRMNKIAQMCSLISHLSCSQHLIHVGYQSTHACGVCIPIEWTGFYFALGEKWTVTEQQCLYIAPFTVYCDCYVSDAIRGLF